ncbi:MAG: hypothetical protein HWE30_13010 [Methylocystaceae bacterium]|nr:hypothetical protein [Methylocystaceae bacterium]
MKQQNTELELPYIDHGEMNKSGVTVFGINEEAEAFEPLFTMETRAEAEAIIRKLCKACEIVACPEWKRAIKACYCIVDHQD